MRRLFLALMLAGCAGDLEHPEQFSLTSDGGAACDAPKTVFAMKCTQGACHAWTSPAARLDLQSPGVGARLRDVTAMGCGSGKLIDSANPSASVLLERLGMSSCGGVMPPGVPLSESERNCVTAWVTAGAP